MLPTLIHKVPTLAVMNSVLNQVCIVFPIFFREIVYSHSLFSASSLVVLGIRLWALCPLNYTLLVSYTLGPPLLSYGLRA